MGGFAGAQSFSRLYMIPGAYHCLGGGDPAVTADFLTPLMGWVEHGRAPATTTLPVKGQTAGGRPQSITVRPFDALAPVPPGKGLNRNYAYIGIRSAFDPHNELWCRLNGPNFTCTPQRP
jgi:Tannase and feruloyl esterase